MNKIGLGTVQFGLDYGVSNQTGVTADNDIRKILDEAKGAHVRVIDTASDYGNSEERLGMLGSSDPYFRVVSKFRLPTEGYNSDWMMRKWENSLQKLGRESLYGYMFHSVQDVLTPDGEGAYSVLTQLKQRKVCEKIGVSVYNGDDLDKVFSRFKFDLVQVPFNLFDHRLLKSNHLKNLHEQGVEIHVRSIFLQGLIFLDPDKMPAYFAPISEKLRLLRKVAKLRGMTLAQIALGFASNNEYIDSIIVGVNTADQFRINLADALNSMNKNIDYSEFSIENSGILNPAMWPKVR